MTRGALAAALALAALLLAGLALALEPAIEPARLKRPPEDQAPDEAVVTVWKERAASVEAVPAGVLARASEVTVACPEPSAVDGQPRPCAPEGEARERVEIDWDAVTPP